MMEDWKVRVRHGFDTLMTEIIVYRHLHDGRVEVQDAKGDVVSYDRGTSAVVPTFRIHEFLLQELVEAIKSSGTRTKDESRTEGKLEATERHLADMRQMLKLK